MENFCVDSNTIFFVSQTSLSKKVTLQLQGGLWEEGGERRRKHRELEKYTKVPFYIFCLYGERCLIMLFCYSWTWRLRSCRACPWAGIWVQICAYSDRGDGAGHLREVEGMQVQVFPVHAIQVFALSFLWSERIKKILLMLFLVLIEKCNPNAFLSYFVKGCNMKNDAFHRAE